MNNSHLEISDERHAIIILGMHRSGTSTTSGIFYYLGFDLGKTIMPANFANLKGNFENLSIVNFNNKLFAKIGASWHNTIFIKEDAWDMDKLANERIELIQIINEEFSTSKTLLFKDPRMCALLPFYLKIFKELVIIPLFVINYRHPIHASSSLSKRDHFPMSKSIGLWMDNMLKSELYTKGFPRIFLGYSNLLIDPISNIKSILKKFNLEIEISQELAKKISKFVDPSMNHNTYRGDTNEDSLTELAIDLYQVFEKLDLKDSIAESINGIDSIRKSFYSMLIESQNPKVSFITWVNNSCIELEKTINSIIRQNYQNIEYHLILDNPSDIALDVFRKYQYMFHWSTFNESQYNHPYLQAIKTVSGDWINILPAGVELASLDVVTSLMQTVPKDTEMIYCNYLLKKGKREYNTHVDRGTAKNWLKLESSPWLYNKHNLEEFPFDIKCDKYALLRLLLLLQSKNKNIYFSKETYAIVPSTRQSSKTKLEEKLAKYQLLMQYKNLNSSEKITYMCLKIRKYFKNIFN